MVQFSCADVVPGCTARFSAASEVEVLRQVTTHSWLAHDLAMPHLPARVTRQVLASVRQIDLTAHEAAPATAAAPA